jgi:diphosphomevalonate decarboxylase
LTLQYLNKICESVAQNNIFVKIIQFMSTNDFIQNLFSYFRKRWIQWSAPSNIALVKYWGKKTIKFSQSISEFTLNCKTITKLSFRQIFRLRSTLIQTLFVWLTFLKGNQRRFQTEDQNFERIEVYLPFWKTIILRLIPRIRFHSSGSHHRHQGMAVAMNLMSLEKR